MAYTFKGTRITGTSTTAKVFKNSGIKSAKSNDTYFNTETGHVYKCSKAGKASVAEWAYVRTDISNLPHLTVTGLSAPKRTTKGSNTHIMEASWKIPKNLINEKKGDRAENLRIYWWLGMSGKNNSAEGYVEKGASTTSHQINLNNVKLGKTTYTRASFYPAEGKPKLQYVAVGVRPINSKGDGVPAVEHREFLPPKAPSISSFSFNKENGELTCTISTNAGTGYQERYDTKYEMYIKKSWESKETLYSQGSGTTTETSKLVKYDATGYQYLEYGQYIRVRVKAWARGYAGNSEPAEKRYYVAYPAQASIEDVKFSGYTGTDLCRVRVKTNQNKDKSGQIYNPVDKVKLEYLANVDYATASAIPPEDAWQDSGNLDDGQCTALAMPVANLICEPGKWSYLRVVTYHANEDVLFRYSEYRQLTSLHKDAPTAADDEIVVVSALPNPDGVSADVTLAWDAVGSSSDDATGTELSWDTDRNAWRSTKEPSTHEFTWYDSGSITHEGVTYRKHATITIKGLSEGETYYVRARRYLEGDVTTYGEYSPDVDPVIVTRSAEAIVATCNPYVSIGESLPITWTLSGGGLQREWSVVEVTGYDEHDEPIDGTPIASGSGSFGYTQIDASRLVAFATNNVVTFTVQASTGAKPIRSEPLTVRIAERPTLTIDAPQTLTTNALSFTATASTVCDLSIVISSQGSVSQTPDGTRRQSVGDTIYSILDRAVAWEELNGMQVATINLPMGLDFWDLGTYTISVTAIDRTSGLKSDEAAAEVSVLWAHQAPDPFDAVTLVPVDEVDDAGHHRQAVEIHLTPPTGSEETDVYDIYRLTGDGASLIGLGFPLTYTAVDEYAPFGQAMTLNYRIAIRTADGDVSFADIEYVAEGSAMRFDWADGSLELPYNISISDSYSKDVDIRKHLNGGMDGYWNQNIERKASLSSDVVRLVQEDDIIKARQLARYAGPVFVRTPDGSAYEADVQVSDMSTGGVITAIAVDAVEVDLTEEFMLPTPNEVDEEA